MNRTNAISAVVLVCVAAIVGVFYATFGPAEEVDAKKACIESNRFDSVACMDYKRQFDARAGEEARKKSYAAAAEKKSVAERLAFCAQQIKSDADCARFLGPNAKKIKTAFVKFDDCVHDLKQRLANMNASRLLSQGDIDLIRAVQSEDCKKIVNEDPAVVAFFNEKPLR